MPGTALATYRWQQPAPSVGVAPTSVIFVHGISDSAGCWQPIIDGLLGELPGPADLIAYDARGHGRSQPLGCAGLARPARNHADLLSGAATPTGAAPATPALPLATLARLADDLIAVIRTLRLRRPVVVGHSLGAVTAVLAEARHPGLARALLLEDPPSPWTAAGGSLATGGAEDTTPPPLPEWLSALRGRRLDELEAVCARAHPSWLPDERNPWAAAKQTVAAEVGWLFAALRRDWSPALGAVRCPVLVVAGEAAQGSLLDATDAARLVGSLPRGKLVTLRGAGHNVRRERRPEYLALLLDTIARS